MKSLRILASVVGLVVVLEASFASAQSPEPGGWYAGDMHVHRSCGGSPESVSSMFSRMSPQNLAVVSQLADSGNGEVQNPTTDLPLVNGQDDPISQIDKILHWDTEWHWDPTYSQYPHQALGGHIVNLGLSSGQQLWQEYTFPILDWAHQHGGIAGFAHLQYLDGTGLPNSLTCCTPIEYPVEIALGGADFISEDVDDVNWPGSSMYSESPIQAYYKLLNSGFRPGLAAGTDYPCNSADNGGALGGLLTYVQVSGGQLTYRGWIEGIATGRTVVSRNGHNEFLSLTVNGTATPGDEIELNSAGSVQVSVEWTANTSLSGTIELVQNGSVIRSLTASAGPSSPATTTWSIPFNTSGWLAVRRMGTNPNNGNYEHYVHTAAVFVLVNNAPIRTSSSDAQYFVNWMNGLIQNTSAGGIWNSYFPTQLTQAQARYQAAKSLYQQIASEANGTGPTLSSVVLSPANPTIGTGSEQAFVATGTYSNGTTLNITAQAKWNSSNTAVAVVNSRGLARGIGQGTTTITASLNGSSASTGLTVASSPLIFSPQSLGVGTVGVPYSASLSATGGTAPYTWQVTSGSLPTGLSLNGSTGSITGTPTVAGTFNFSVEVSDSGVPAQNVTRALSIAVATSTGTSCPCSIWPSTAVPSIPDSGPDSAVELGVKFRSDSGGYITGIRFYKGIGNIGTHIGNLWSSAGQLLASVTFSGESGSGWQQANFSTPVAINANTVYVASYHTNVGDYSDDQGFFANGVDTPPLHALADGISGFDGVFAYGAVSSFPDQGWNSSNYWVDIAFMPANTPASVLSVIPANGAAGVGLGAALSAVFSESMTGSTITGGTFFLKDSSGATVPANVIYVSASSTATLTPSTELAPQTTYTATLRGGANGIEDFSGTPLASDFTWSFTTGGAPLNSGPGGPILAISNVVNPFSQYYSEILNAEGFNEYTVSDISTVTAGTLSNYDVVILGEMPLSGSQVSMLTNWVNGGGHLIAMRPDPQLATLLGLSPNNSSLSNAYLQVQTASGPGIGIVGQTIQFHGPADLYTVSGATSLATLYSNASTSAGFPAVTIAYPGAGQAVAFTYDLARSVVYTRQGNPAWSGEDRDGQIPPIRSDDLYFGAASFDPEADWVDLTKVQIPQADEQQRLLGNVILQMNSSIKPLPRFWYFPSGFKAAVVLTGDDHGSFYSGSATSQRFSDDLAGSPAGCAVTDWTCVRATAYLFPQAIASNPLSNAQVATYVAQGFEVGVHADSNPTCSNWSTAELDSYYSTLLASLAVQFPSLPAPQTHRMHCISWSDYDSQPQIELKHGIRLDTSYYYWPPAWVNDQPGMFTGSGMPMRFTDRNGNLINVYQAATQMTDESGQSYPFNTDTLLNNALGATGYYGAFVVNAHNDQGSYPGIGPDVISSAQNHGVPIISAQQLLTWVDGRNASSFGSITWSGNTLTFNITQAAGARNLQAMLPTTGPTGTLSSITLGGNPVTFITQIIKGVSYAMFAATSGTYQAVYGGGGPALVVTSLTVNPTTVVGGIGATGTVALSGQAPTSGTTVTLSSSNSAAAQTPATVVVTSGNTTATFPITTSIVSTNTAVMISGTYGSTQTASLTVTPIPVTLTSIVLNPTSVQGGSASTGTVTVSGPAPTGGVAISLSSSNSAAVVPASVTVAAGATTATFTVSTTPVASSTTANVSAIYGTTVSSPLTITPPSLTAMTLNPVSLIGGSSSTGTVTLSGAAPTGGIGVALASSDSSTAQVPASVTVAAGSSTATFTVTTSAVAANTSVNISATYGGSQAPATLTVNAATVSTLALNPTAVTGGKNSTGTVTLTGPAPVGGASVTLQSSNTAAASAPSAVTIAAGSTSATFTVTTYPVTANTSAIITGTFGTAKSATLTVNAPTLSSVVLSPTSVTAGNTATGTVTLTGVALAGATVTLSSSNTAAAQVPASVTIAAGSANATFTITTSQITSNASVTISGTFGTTKTATLTVNAVTLSSIGRSPTSVVGGANSTGTVTLNRAAPTGGARVTLQSSNTSAAQVPASVTIAAGATSTTFTITTTPVSANASVTITGTYGLARTTTLTVNAPTLSSIARSPTSVVGGNNSTGTLTLNGAAPAGGAVVTLSSSNTAAARVPASIRIPTGSTTATFTITTSGVASSTSVTLSGTYGATRTTSLTVTVASLTSLTLNPGTVTGGSSSTATLTLNGAAPPAGGAVSLTSTNTAVAQVPTSATIAAGTNNVTFTVTTSAVHGTSATIRGTYRSATQSATLTVQ